MINAHEFSSVFSAGNQKSHSQKQKNDENLKHDNIFESQELEGKSKVCEIIRSDARSKFEEIQLNEQKDISRSLGVISDASSVFILDETNKSVAILDQNLDQSQSGVSINRGENNFCIFPGDIFRKNSCPRPTFEIRSHKSDMDSSNSSAE